MQRRSAVKSLLAMLGASVSPSLLAALGAAGDAVAQRTGDSWSPQRRALVAAMAERIIPTTDTPGAIAAGVPAFIEEVVEQWYTDVERGIFFYGLEQAEQLSQQHFAHAFVELKEAQQDVLLAQLERQGGTVLFGGLETRVSLEEDRSPFFKKLKELVVVGYYTSEIGATQELRYERMPMAYRGDIPLSEVGRSWQSLGFID